ncbi:MAG: N-acetylmuramic acid 6-phosphate etherase [Saprospiraceae bacterium]|nr:N-acetylmuramic acid 6-phosphate etherase [Bacteroidia bacterium]NNF20895.1 N-acetylmuramic acid 6-phosphate etherase [Saprospiraceae bacterium]NNK89732.1 N-acetylmuramic acid 6-phosphate etherase [Saprospiraceae bacterium]
MAIQKITEMESRYRHLEKMTIKELLTNINKEDQTVATSVLKVIHQVEPLVRTVVNKMSAGGRLFYIGSGTSGRLGIVDASECPPTFGVPHEWVIGLIAGGDSAIRKAIEFAEDDKSQAIKDLDEYLVNDDDFVIGIAASGTTPYVIGGLLECRKRKILTACITCNPGSPLIEVSDFPVVCPVGPEFVTGSTRMKAGTAQKLILNMISTSVMIKLGRVEDNKMVDMQLSNNKLVDRGTKMIMEKTELDYHSAKTILLKEGSVRAALKSIQT